MIITKQHTNIIKLITIATVSIVAVIGVLLHLQSISRAADLSKFDPGNIMSDAVMSNKSTMSVQQIQAFLDSKNPCDNKNTYMAGWYPHLSYTIRDGKFVCMAKDSFNGKSAAQIIWQAGQDYSINPQVLLVLLEKEQGLISDTWPNNVQYRTATGFGCPDTAPCEAQYFGLENQVRLAANLFHTVLNGGWSNYPVGQTYVQYHPQSSCGGTVVNIQNRATSALYRYTPYQPNRAALNAGYGTGDGCSAYGNRNFYALFTDWFGSTSINPWKEMINPRTLTIVSATHKVDPFTGQPIPSQPIPVGQEVEFTSSTLLPDGETCLRTRANTISNVSMCVRYGHLSEYTKMSQPRNLSTIRDTQKIDPSSQRPIYHQSITRNTVTNYSSKASLSNGEVCLRTEENTRTGANMCVAYRDLSEYTASFIKMSIPRPLYTLTSIEKYDMLTRSYAEPLPANMLIEFESMGTTNNGDLCLRTKADTSLNKPTCILYVELVEIPNFNKMSEPRQLVTRKSTHKRNIVKNQDTEPLPPGLRIDFDMLYITQSQQLCLRTRIDTYLNKPTCILYTDLSEF